MNPRITIIGCGLSGMITALCFAARDINSTIIERQNIESPSFFNDIRTSSRILVFGMK